MDDLLLFEPPADGAEHVVLALPARNVGGTGEVRVKIPRTMWQK